MSTETKIDSLSNIARKAAGEWRKVRQDRRATTPLWKIILAAIKEGRALAAPQPREQQWTEIEELAETIWNDRPMGSTSIPISKYSKLLACIREAPTTQGQPDKIITHR